MRAVLKPVFVAIMLLYASYASAQRSGMAKDPTLNRGEGLEVTRSDLDQMRTKQQDKNARQVDIYMFGASFSVLDSVLCVSYPQEIKSVIVNNRWFVKDRALFEKQFSDFVNGYKENTQMTVIYFSEKLKTVEKRRERLIKRNVKKNGFKLIQVPEFRFSKPLEE